MTRGDIAKASGQELDALVAEHVFGESQPTTTTGTDPQSAKGHWILTKNDGWVALPYRNKALIWDVIKAAQAAGLSFKIEDAMGDAKYSVQFEDLGEPCISDGVGHTSGGHGPYTARAQSVGEAVCRAALLWKAGIRDLTAEENYAALCKELGGKITPLAPDEEECREAFVKAGRIAYQSGRQLPGTGTYRDALSAILSLAYDAGLADEITEEI